MKKYLLVSEDFLKELEDFYRDSVGKLKLKDLHRLAWILNREMARKGYDILFYASILYGYRKGVSASTSIRLGGFLYDVGLGRIDVERLEESLKSRSREAFMSLIVMDYLDGVVSRYLNLREVAFRIRGELMK
jgi:hypothetical protein